MSRFSLTILILLLVTPIARCDGLEGDWFILGENGGCWSNNKNHPASRKLFERSIRNRPLNCVAFTPNDEWIALVGGNEFYFGQDLPVCKKLGEWWKSSDVRNFKCVAFTSRGGWVVIADDNAFHAENIPPGALSKLTALRKDNDQIHSIAFAPNGGWVILSREQVWYSDIPESAGKRLEELAAKQVRVICTAFDYRGNWVILTAGNGIWSNDDNLSVVKQLRELADQKFVLKSVAFSPGDYGGDYSIVRAPTDKVSATLDMNVVSVTGRVKEWSVIGPVAPDYDGQDKMKTTLSPKGTSTVERSQLKRQVLFAHVKDSPRNLHATMDIEGELYSRKLYPLTAGKPKVSDLPQAEFKLYTRQSEHVNFESKSFQTWLDKNGLRRNTSEREITFARRAYSFVRDNFTYVYPGGDEHATSVSDRRSSDCGGLCCVMIAVLRANGIPARMLQGRWAMSSDLPIRIPFQIPGRYHVKAEFFAKGTGWIPFDMAAAVLDRDNGEYAHFGNDPGDFVTMFLDQDFEVDTHIAGIARGLSMQNMVWFWKGAANERFGVELKWTVTKEPVKKP